MQQIVKDLKANCAASLLVSQTITHALIHAHLEQFAPQVLDKGFKILERFVRQFFHDKLRWSCRKATRAAQKTPDNWESQCEDMFLRISYQALIAGVPAEAILNGDQTGLSVIPLGKYTCAPTGAL